MKFPKRPIYKLRLPRNRQMVLGERTLIMGVLNVTPDSFSDGGRFFDKPKAIERAKEMIDEGVDIIDIGGESARPFSDPIPLDEEMRRTIPVIEAVRSISEDIPISIDTTKAEVARAALNAGADIINDISALRFDPDMVRVAADFGVPVVLMHMLGTPKTMQENPTYRSLISEIISFLQQRIEVAVEGGIDFEQLVVDPGIGFGKTLEHNLRLIKDLDLFHSLERPLLLGASRKRFIGAVLDLPVEEREVGTAAVNVCGVLAGAHILRVHDVGFHRQAAMMADAVFNVRS
ncbi:MAG: dihydropteroate synthase [Deltaproteobacteria bacterium]|nr:dihydropteroate synthase [Deltaproteobacteria bacterium]MBW2068551.1 dihydropteroate synthase [Deltaproteobacteria bacterium]